MKIISKVLASGLLLLFALAAQAQFVSPPVTKQVLTNASSVPFIVPADTIGTFSTNLPTTIANIVTVGKDGFSIGFNMTGTNSLTVTNLAFLFESTSDGVNWTTNTPAGGLLIIATPRATTYGPSYTNLLSATANLNIGNLTAVRLRAIANSNGTANGAVYITNLTISTR